MGLPRRHRTENRRIPSKINVGRITNNGRNGGWGNFRYRLAKELGVTPEEYKSWNVPQAWIDAFKAYFRGANV